MLTELYSTAHRIHRTSRTPHGNSPAHRLHTGASGNAHREENKPKHTAHRRQNEGKRTTGDCPRLGWHGTCRMNGARFPPPTSEEPLSPPPDGRTPADQGSPRQLHLLTCLCPPLEDGCSPEHPSHRFNCRTPGSCGKHTARSCISPSRQTQGCLRRHTDSFLPTRQTAPGSITK